MDIKGRNNFMALISAWMFYCFKLKYQLEQDVYVLGIYFYGLPKEHIGDMDIRQEQGPEENSQRLAASLDISCF